MITDQDIIDVEQTETKRNYAKEDKKARGERSIKAQIDFRASKESSENLGITTPKRWQFTLHVWKDAGAIKRFQKWLTTCDLFFKDRGEREILIQALWNGMKNLVESTEQFKIWSAAYHAGEFNLMPSEIKQMFDDFRQEKDKRDLMDGQERLDTNYWLYRKLGKEEFIRRYESIEDFASILAYCEDLESSKLANATMSKTEKIQVTLAELAQTHAQMKLCDIREYMVTVGAIDDLKDDSTLKWVGNRLGLSNKEEHGMWDLSKLLAG